MTAKSNKDPKSIADRDAFFRVPNIISALRILGAIVFKRFSFPHTMANKMTGLLLFLTVPTVFWSIVPFAVVAGIAAFAAIQEGHFIRTGKV